MSAERLREAARVLRERAEAATPGPWKRYGMAGVAAPDWEIVDERRIECECGEPVALTGCVTNADALYIATVSPPFALAVAEWLDVTARDEGTSTTVFHAARAVADTVLGAES